MHSHAQLAGVCVCAVHKLQKMPLKMTPDSLERFAMHMVKPNPLKRAGQDTPVFVQNTSIVRV
eukprot:m.337152 g.337152  ORF g.337152 m.337152 type:complete len:63 (-) comp16079_c3_seq13:1188-1376(-)